MTARYLVQICTPTITPVIVVADSNAQARERALKSEGDVGQPLTEEAEIKAVTRLEG
jgi:hypothetical protein